MKRTDEVSGGGLRSGVRRGRGRIFTDRREAGRKLAAAFVDSRPRGDIVVLGLPRGGVPVAFELARALRAPLDVFVVRKLGAPGQHELAVGAVATGGVTVYNHDVLHALGLQSEDIEHVRRAEQAELARRERVYLGERQPPVLSLKTVILVDDGIATGATMRAAVQAARAARPRTVIVAAPTGARESVALLEESADTVVVLEVPEPYIAVGAWYEYFPQVTDEEVIDILAQARTSLARDAKVS